MEEHKEVRVLVVDDDMHARESLAKWLQRAHKYTVDTAENGKKAIARVQGAKGCYDVVLMDQELLPNKGELNGIETMKSIKAEYPDLAVVVITGYGDVDSGITAMREGAYRYILKTDRANEEIAIMIRSIVEQQRLKAERDHLRDLLEMNATVQSARDLDRVLKTIAETVHGFLGFGMVAVSLLETGQIVRVRAMAGLDEDEIRQLTGATYSWDDFAYPMQDRFRISRSYFIRYRDFPWRKGPFIIRDLGERKGGEWHTGDLLRVPILDRQGQTIGILSVNDPRDRKEPSLERVHWLEAFADQVATAIENARFYSQAEQRARNLATLQQVSATISSSFELDEILRLTCESTVKLFGVDHSGLVLFEPGYKQGKVVAEYPDKGVLGVEIPVLGVPAEERLIATKEPLVLPDVTNEPSLKTVLDILRRFDIRSILIVPMVFKDKVIGSFSLDAIGKPRLFQEEEIELAQTFAAQAAIAVENARAYASQKEAKDYLDKLIASSLDGIIAVDTEGWITLFNEGAERILGYRKEEVLGKKIRVDAFHESLENAKAINRLLYEHGKLENYECTIKDKDYTRIPVMLSAVQSRDDQGNVTGSVGFLKDLRSLKKAEAKLRLLLNVGESIAQLVTNRPKDVLKQIVQGACEVIGASCAVIYPYYVETRQYDLESVVAHGLSMPESFSPKDKARESESSMAASIVAGGTLLIVPDVDKHPDARIKGSRFLQRENIQAFAGLPLRVGQEPVGILFINFREPHDFTQDEQDTIKIFANQAAVAIKQARLFEQVSEEATQLRLSLLEVGRSISELRGVEGTLHAVAQGIQQVLGCDVVTVYSYDEESGLFPHPAVVAGKLRVPQKMGGYGHLLRNKIFQLLLEKHEAHFADNSPTDTIMSTGGFVEREKIRSSAGATLFAGGHPVGLLFVNFRKRHQFSDNEKTAIHIFANQAAIAIHNAKLYEKTQRAYEETQKAKDRLETVAHISREASTTLELAQFLEALFAGLEKHFKIHIDPNVMTYDKEANALLFHSTSHYRIDASGEESRKTIPVSGRGITAHVAQTRQSHYAPDVSLDPYYLHLVSSTKSEICVPICLGKEFVGVLDIESPVINAFTEDDQKLLETLADQIAVAIRNAQQYANIEKKSAHLSALYEASKSITASFGLERRKILDCIVQQAVERITGIYPPKAKLGIIQLYNQAANELRLESVYPPQEVPNLLDKIGETRSLDASKAPEGRLGISGRAVLSGRPQLVKDAESHPDYHKINPDTRSELDVPLLDGDKVIGVLGMESNELNAFDEDDQRTLQALADLAVIVIRNAERQKELLKTREQAVRREALSRLGLIRSTWTHRVRGDAATICEGVELLLKAIPSEGPFMEVRKIVGQIGEQAKDILAVEMGGAQEEELIESVAINALLGERALLLCRRYGDIILERGSRVDDSVTVRADRKWLKTAVDHIIQNALDAMSKITTEKRLTVSTLINEDKTVGILVRDTGPGIPPTVLEKLGVSSVPKRPGEKGTGTGWLVVRTIAESLGGSADVVETGPRGTVVKLSLPITHD